MDVQFEFPLQWLPQQPRSKYPRQARFGQHSASRSGDYLLRELRLLGAQSLIISSNLRERARGVGFYANQGKVDDAGVVAYFRLKGKDKAMACDKWRSVEDNLWALFLSVQAIRGLERWGGSEFLDGLFSGFSALPSPDMVSVGMPQFFAECINKEQARERYLILCKELHPDVNESDGLEFAEMKRQYERFIKGDEK